MAGLKQVLVALDQLLNTLLWFLPGGCWADETLSSRAWRIRNIPDWGWLYQVIDAIWFWEKNHCYQSYVSERDRLQLPPEYR